MARGVELDEVMGLSVPEPLALVSRLIVHRLPGFVGNVRNPVGQAGELLGDARAAGKVRSVRLRLLVRLHRLVYRAVACVLAGAAASATGNQDGSGEGK
jgi:hypothetical protein